MAVAQLPGPAAAAPYRMPRLLGVPAPAQLGAALESVFVVWCGGVGGGYTAE